MEKLFKCLYHVTFFVNDIKKSLEFYKACGFEVLFDLRVSPEKDPWNIFVSIAPNQTIELQPLDAEKPFPAPEKSRTYPDQTFFHAALLCDDMDATIKELMKRGVTVWTDPGKHGVVTSAAEAFDSPDGCLVAWVVDPDGNPFEIMQQQEGKSLQAAGDKAKYGC